MLFKSLVSSWLITWSYWETLWTFSCIRYLSILSRVCSNKQMDSNMPGRFSLLQGSFWTALSICLLSWKKWKDDNLVFTVAWITQCPKLIRNCCASALSCPFYDWPMLCLLQQTWMYGNYSWELRKTFHINPLFENTYTHVNTPNTLIIHFIQESIPLSLELYPQIFIRDIAF